MSMQFSVDVRNARLAAFAAAVGPSPRLCILTGDKPASCAAAETGTLLCEIKLPEAWLSEPADGAVSLAGDWTGTAVGAGDAGYFRIVDHAGKCHQQGLVGGQMTLDSVTLAIGQTVTVTGYQVTDGNM